MLAQYREEADRRAAQGVPPLPLTEEQAAELTRLLTDGHPEQDTLLELLAERVEPGVSRAAKVKAAWLEQVAVGSVSVTGFTPEAAITMLAHMGGGYNVAALIRLLHNEQLRQPAADALLDYYDLGVSTFLIRGFDPLDDAVAYGRDLIPLVRELVAERDARPAVAAG